MARDTQVPDKSRAKYDQAYQEYRKWCLKNNIETTTDDSILMYFTTDLAPYKASTLWPKYSMLRSTINLFEGIDISTFPSIIPYLKSKGDDHKTTKSLTLSKDHVDKFLAEANNKEHLLNKVILIFGIAGACRRQELASLTTTCIEDRGTHFLVQLIDTETKKVRYFRIEPGEVRNMSVLDIIRMYLALRPANINHDRFFINYLNEKCTVQPVGVHKIGKVPQVVAKYLRLENAQLYTSHCFRRTWASILANAGVTIGEIKRHTKWHASTTAIGCEPENRIPRQGTSTAEPRTFVDIGKKNNKIFCGSININKQKLSGVGTAVTVDRWPREKCLRLIDEYRQHEMLWNISNPEYSKEEEKQILWNELAKKFCADPEVVKRKIEIMRGFYRRERSKYHRSLASGGEIYNSSWFAYESLKFLDFDDSTKMDIKEEYEEDEEPFDEYYGADESMDISMEDIESLLDTDEDSPLLTETVMCDQKPFSTGESAKRKRLNDNDDVLLNALGHVTKYSNDVRSRLQDESSIFGELVTHKLRKLDEKSRAIAQHKIQNVFYDLQMSSSSYSNYQFYENNRIPESDPLVSENVPSVNSNAST